MQYKLNQSKFNEIQDIDSSKLKKKNQTQNFIKKNKWQTIYKLTDINSLYGWAIQCKGLRIRFYV